MTKKSKSNFWTISENTYFGYWRIQFPFESKSRLEKYIKFVQGLESLSQDTNLMNIQVAGGGSFVRREDYAFSQFIKDEALKSNEIRFMLPGIGTTNKSISSLICLYDKEGKLVAKETDNLGALLYELYPEKMSPLFSKVAIPPVQIVGPPINLPINEEREEELLGGEALSLSIELKTDIWFPRVIGYFEDEFGIYDNNELANCHTPRLNRFLFGLRQVAHNVGATWSLEANDVHGFYKKWLTETGINLDKTEDD